MIDIFTMSHGTIDILAMSHYIIDILASQRNLDETEITENLNFNPVFLFPGSVAHPTATEPQHLCHVLTTGVFPVMAVTDARCYGSAVGISKKQLWSLFSLDK
jgi:hypothetical protein